MTLRYCNFSESRNHQFNWINFHTVLLLRLTDFQVIIRRIVSVRRIHMPAAKMHRSNQFPLVIFIRFRIVTRRSMKFWKVSLLLNICWTPGAHFTLYDSYFICVNDVNWFDKNLPVRTISIPLFSLSHFFHG